MAEEKKPVPKQRKKQAAPKQEATKPAAEKPAPKPVVEKPAPKPVAPKAQDQNILSAGDLAKTPVGLCQILEVFDNHCVVAKKENLKVKYQISKESIKKESK